MTDVDDEDAHYRFKIGMLVRHPTFDLKQVLRPPGIGPDNSRIAGHPRVAPNGQAIPGRYRESFWNWSRLVAGKSDFMDSVGRLIDTLELHRAVLLGVTDGGGSAAVNIALPGPMNIGSSRSFSDMARLVGVKTDLGVEVFPDPRNFRS